MLRRRLCHETIAVAIREQTAPVAIVGVDELGVPARGAEDHRGDVLVAALDRRSHAPTVSRLGKQHIGGRDTWRGEGPRPKLPIGARESGVPSAQGSAMPSSPTHCPACRSDGSARS